MDAGTFKNPTVAQRFRDFERVKMDCTTRGANSEHIDRFGVEGFPTVVVLDKTGKRLGSIEGPEPPDAFLRELDGILAGEGGNEEESDKDR